MPGLDVGVGGGVLREGEGFSEEVGGDGVGEEGAGGVSGEDEGFEGVHCWWGFLDRWMGGEDFWWEGLDVE